MKYLLLASLLALASCKTSRPVSTPLKHEVIRYAAYKSKCQYPDGFGMDKVAASCDSGTVTVRSADIVKRTDSTIKVVSGFCTYIYIIR